MFKIHLKTAHKTGNSNTINTIINKISQINNIINNNILLNQIIISNLTM